jgi:excinuclease ABC subunit C
MKDAKDLILYIGKASNIKKRVSSYFYGRYTPSARTQMLISRVKKIGHIITISEAEALILESSLIKRHRPKYNVALKDDKSYPYLKLTVAEDYPRLFVTRKIKNDGSRYFGPYTNAKLLRKAVYMMKRIFQLRVCNRLPKSECLNYHLKQCLAPCIGEVDKRQYNMAVGDLILFLEGKKELLLKDLTTRMLDFAKDMKFEEASKIRDRIEALGIAVKGRVQYDFDKILTELKQVLGLKKIPKRIEAFDVSTLFGKEAVGSMIPFYNMKFEKNSYRKFKIKTVEKIDDYRMMQEIVSRRYERVLKDKLLVPDLIIIDGGRGHLSVAKKALDRLGLSRIPVIGIAKEFEHIYLPTSKEPIRLPRNSGILHLIQRMRDEAHRFAIAYHRRLREKKSSYSSLDEVDGIGNKRKKELIRHFGDLGSIRKASLEELAKVKSINRGLAKEILKTLKANK